MNERTVHGTYWKKMIRSASGFIVVVFLSSFVLVSAHAYVSPGRPSGFVNDYAGMLSSMTRATLEQELRAYKQRTTNEVVIATIPSLGDETVEAYAVRLFEEWKPGMQGKDNGIIVLVSRDDRKVKIEVGYGLEGDLNDGKAGWIIRNVMTPRFKEGDYDAGLTDGVHRIVAALSGESTPEIAVSTSGNTTSGFLSFILEVGIFILLGLFGSLGHFLGKTKSWWLGGVIGGGVGLILAFWIANIIFSGVVIVALSVFGLFVDYHLSRTYDASKQGKPRPWWWGGGMYGGGGSIGGGGGFGGFGGGSSGGGGASGSW